MEAATDGKKPTDDTKSSKEEYEGNPDDGKEAGASEDTQKGVSGYLKPKKEVTDELDKVFDY